MLFDEYISDIKRPMAISGDEEVAENVLPGHYAIVG